MLTTVTSALAEHVAALRYQDIPAGTLERAKDLLLDHLGVALSGSTLPWARIVHAQVLAEGGRCESTLLGGGRVPARSAALANGTAAHANEFDDTHDEALNHPACVVMPAALAVAEARGLGGRELLTAIVAGYEVQCRVGAALGAALLRRGHHPTATCGVFGAAAATARLMDLGAADLISAWGSAASMSSGLMRFAEDPAGTMIKRMHGGLPAERGVLAAQLAARGLQGPHGAIEGERGFNHVMAGNEPLTRILAGLGTRFELDSVSVKLYTCCKMFHALIEAIAQCRQQAGFAADDIASVTVRGPMQMLDSHMQYEPESEMAAQYSLPYTTAAALLLDPRTPESFSSRARARPDVRRITRLVRAEVDASMQAAFPTRCAGGVTIRLQDGRLLEAAVFDSESSVGRPLPRAAVRDKFDRLTEGLMDSVTRERVGESVANLQDCRDVAELMALLAIRVSRAP